MDIVKMNRKRRATWWIILAFFAVSLPAFAGNGKIAGVVLDDSGDVLPGANVVVEVGGEKVGAIADEKGRIRPTENQKIFKFPVLGPNRALSSS